MDPTSQVLQNLPQTNLPQEKPHKKRYVWALVLILIVIVSAFIGYGIYVHAHTHTTNQKQVIVDNVPSPKIHKRPTPMTIALGLHQPTNPSITPIKLAPVPTRAINYATPTQDPVMGTWKTYTDPSGFSLDYPSEWTIKPYQSDNCGNSVSLDTSNSDTDYTDTGIKGVEIEIDVNATQDTCPRMGINEWVYDSIHNGSITLQPTLNSIDGYPAIKYTSEATLEGYLLYAPGFATNNADYTITFTASADGLESTQYLESDPFIQKQLSNFHLLISSIQFPKQ